VRRHVVPAWWRDAKLGIFIHWTPASVPAFAPVGTSIGELLETRRRDALAFSPYSEWYENSLRFPSSPAARYHAEHYPGRSYEEFAAEWEAGLAQWDPESWADEFARCGARYVVLVTKHHDGYCLWPTSVDTPHRKGWFSRRDVVGELAEAVRGRGLRFGVYYSGGLDSRFNDHAVGTFSDLLAAVPRGAYVEYAEAQVRELISRYRPSVLWNDIAWPGNTRQLARLLADYYSQVPEGVVNDRFMPWSLLMATARTGGGRRLLDQAVARAAANDAGVVPPKPPLYDVRTPEYSVFPTIQREPWECVRGIDASFGHNRAADESAFLSRQELVWSFIDIVSKGGNLLLNVGPRGEDAAIPPLQLQRLEWLGQLTSAAGAALYASRPWVRPGETSGGCEVRYTARDQVLYAFARPTGASPLDRVPLPGVRSDRASTAADLAGDKLTLDTQASELTVELRVPATAEEPGVVALRGVTASPKLAP
jgi:alpha-L-fucosidase